MTEYPSRVKLAGPEDEDRLYEHITAGPVLDPGFGFGVPYSPEKVRAQIEVATRRQGGMIGLIKGKDSEIAASVCLVMSSWWYSAEIYLGEVWLYVSPDYRHNGFEKDLFRFCKWGREQFSAAMGRPVALVTSVSSPTRLDAKTRLWRRLCGGRQVGSIFVNDGSGAIANDGG